MRHHNINFIKLMQVCSIILLVSVPCYSNSTEQTLPRGVVAFSALVDPNEYTADGGCYDLFLQTTHGCKVTQLTNRITTPKLKLGGAIREPLFSHDGKRVIFLADYSNSDDRRMTMTGSLPYPNTFLNVWEVQLDTQKVSPVTKGDWGWRIFGWSPDDHYICAVYQIKQGFLEQDKPIPNDIYVWDMNMRKGQKLARVPNGVEYAFWSHDGKSILYQSCYSGNLYSVPREGGESNVLLHGKVGRYGYNFSPDGRKIAYVDGDTIYIANTNGTKPKPILKMSKNSYPPEYCWSRDSKKLAIVTNEPLENSLDSTNFRVYDDNTGKDGVVATLHESVKNPVWSRDGQWLIVKKWDAGSTEKPDPKTGWHMFRREGLLAVSVTDGHVVILKEPNEETKGLDWVEIAN
ncbi:MAG: hypothetical protein ABFD46_02755 [Armatimonadota bacterium]